MVYRSSDTLTDRHRRIDSIQALRGIAFLFIFLGHCSVIPSGFAAFGVSIFIILSGFLLTIKNGRRIDTNVRSNVKFAWRKIKRLFPLHVICTLLMMLICTDFSSVLSVVQNIVKSALNIFLVQSWIPKIDISMSLNGVAWYLSTCVFLFFLYPYISRFIRKYKIIIEPILYSALAITLMIIIRIATLQFGDDFSTWATYCFPLYRLLDFFVGCNIGWLVRNYKEIMTLQKRSYFTYLEFLSICACFIVSYLQSKTYASYMLKTVFTSAIIDLPISCLLVVMFYLHNGDVTSKLENKILVEIGNLSPYLFLIHYTVIAYCRAVLSKITSINISVLLVPISFCISIMLAHLYRNLIEDKRNVSN